MIKSCLAIEMSGGVISKEAYESYMKTFQQI